MKNKILFFGIILLGLALLAAIILTGCAPRIVNARTSTPDDTTWPLDQWKGNTTKFIHPVKISDGTVIKTTNFKMYIFRCSENWAQITPDTYKGAAVWVPRSVLADDPCESGKLTGESTGPLLVP